MTATTDAPALLVPGSVEWHAKRQLGVGSSESPALFDRGFAGESAMKVYVSKVLPPEQLAAEKSSAAMERGTEMEDYLARQIARRRGWVIRKVPTQRDAKGDPLVSSLDYVIFGETDEPVALFECKTASFRTLAWEDPELVPDGVPERVRIQVEHQLEVGLEWKGRWYYPRRAYVGACINHLDDVRTYTIDKNDVMGQAIRARAVELWTNHVVPRVPPAWDGTSAGNVLLLHMFPADRKPLRKVDGTDPVVALVSARTELHARITAEETERDALDQRIKEAIGDAEGIATPLGAVTWKKNKDGSKTDWQSVAADVQRELAQATSEPVAASAATAAMKSNTHPTVGARVLRGPWSQKK